jgi:hypothetical protein
MPQFCSLFVASCSGLGCLPPLKKAYGCTRHSRIFCWEVPMAMGRLKAALVLRPEQRAQLESMASAGSLPAGLVTRTRIVLLSAAGKMNQQIARQLGLTKSLYRTSTDNKSPSDSPPGL